MIIILYQRFIRDVRTDATGVCHMRMLLLILPVKIQHRRNYRGRSNFADLLYVPQFLYTNIFARSLGGRGFRKDDGVRG